MSDSESKWWETDPYAEKPAIGVVLHKIDGQWSVACTLLGSPAAKAGVEKGDILLAIGGNSLLSNIDEVIIEKTLSFAREGEDVEVALLHSQKAITVKMPFEPLKKLLEYDERLRGARLSCYACKSCRPTVIGVADCQLTGGNCSIPCSIA